MSLTARDYKAIEWYIETNNLKPQLSAPPTMYFIDADGNEVTKSLEAIKLEWSAWNEEDKRARARARTVKKAARYDTRD